MFSWKVFIVSTLLHGVLLAISFGVAFSEGMKTSESEIFRYSSGAFEILSLPLMNFPDLVYETWGGILGWVLYPLNSILWGLCIPVLVCGVYKFFVEED